MRRCYCETVRRGRAFLRQEVEPFLVEPWCDRVWNFEQRNLSRSEETGFDLIYSADLLTNVPQQEGGRVVTAALSLLRPGGRMILGNLTRGAQPEFCRFCAGREIHERTEEELAQFTKDLDGEALSGQVVYGDTESSHVFLELHKRVNVLTQ